MLVMQSNQHYIEFPRVNWSTLTKQINMIHQTYRIVVKERTWVPPWNKNQYSTQTTEISTLLKWLVKNNSRDNVKISLNDASRPTEVYAMWGTRIVCHLGGVLPVLSLAGEKTQNL